MINLKKRGILLALLAIVTIFLSGCAGVENQTGFFYNVFVRPFSWFIHEVGGLLGGNYAFALIILTLLVRLFVLPMMLRVYKNQQHMRVAMEKMKPELDELQKKMKEAKTPEEQRQLQAELLQIYQKHNFNPLGIGCLPILIQMPILTGVYWAIRSSEEIASQHFLWFNLGQPDIIMTLLAGLIYFIQAEVSLKLTSSTMTEQQMKQMKFMSYISPIMIMVISLGTPAALPLYWTVGGTFLIFQTWLGHKLYRKPMEEEKAKGSQ